MDRWKSKVAVVTGASAGIGAAIAEELVKHGVLVVGVARRKELMDALAAKLKNEPGKLYPLKGDLARESEILDAFAWIKANLGPISILVNNAGITAPDNLIDGDTENWAKVIDINVLGLCICTREAVKDMRANGVDGHIVHISGISGHYVPRIRGISMTCATKSAITALTETLRQELNSINSKIKISSISPGVVDTDILRGVRLGEGTLKDSNIPKLNAKDVADAALYILSTPSHVQVHSLVIRPIGENF